MLKAGAGGLKPILERLRRATARANIVGFGWLGSYIVLSGSPVAAVALTLFSKGVLTDTETFAMINGSRMGASFIVLFVGFLYWVRGRRNPDGLYIGVVALLTAFTLWAPVIPLGQLILREGWFDGVRFGSPGAVTSLVNVVYDPMVTRMADHLPRLAMFAIGIGVLLLSFSIFDRVLPNLEQPGPRFERLVDVPPQRYTMFVFGLLVTGMTLSVVALADDPRAAHAEGLREARQHHPVRHGREHRDVDRHAVRGAAARHAARVHDRLRRDGHRRYGLADRALFLYEPYKRADPAPRAPGDARPARLRGVPRRDIRRPDLSPA